jgi:lambda repressor-like predicted transcriptional regulator
MATRTGPPHDAVLREEIIAAVNASGMKHEQIAKASGVSLSSLRSKLYGSRRWDLEELESVAAALGKPAAPWLPVARVGDIGAAEALRLIADAIEGTR